MPGRKAFRRFLAIALLPVFLGVTGPLFRESGWHVEEMAQPAFAADAVAIASDQAEDGSPPGPFSVGLPPSSPTATPTPGSFTPTPTVVVATATPTPLAPTNDDFEAALVISSAPFIETVDTSLASLQAGEQRFCLANDRTVWYAYTPEHDVVLRATASYADGYYFQPTVAAYRGDTLGTLTLITCDFADVGPAQLDAPASAGDTVYFQVAASIYPPGSKIAFSLEETPQPSNDDFAAAMPISSLPSEFSSSLRGGTAEAGEPPWCFPPHEVLASVWFSYTADQDTTLRATASSGFAITVDMFSGTDVSSLVPISACGYRVQANVVAGETVYIRASTRQRESFTVRFEPISSPANDNFADREPITALPFSTTVDIDNASFEPGEPSQCYGGLTQNSVWFTFTATTDTVLQLETPSGGFAEWFGIYRGTELSNLERITCFDGINRIPVLQGETIQIQAMGPVTTDSMPVLISAVGAPANDFFERATAIDSFPFEEQVDVTHASLEFLERTECPDAYFFHRTVWYEYTPSVDTTLVIEVADGEFGPGLIAAYTGSSLGALTSRACEIGSARVRVDAGETIRLQASPRYTETVGIRINAFPPPPNDHFADAIPITALPFAHSQPMVNGSSTEPGEPTPCADLGGSVWYSYTAPQDVVFSFSATAGAASAYRGSTLSTLTYAGCSFGQLVSFLVTAGSTVYIQGTGPDSFILNAQSLVPPPNDGFSSAQEISALPFVADIALDTASSEPGEPTDCGAGPSVWYRYTSPAAQTLTASARPYGTVAIYAGAQLNALTLLDCGYSDNVARERLGAGQSVLLRYTGLNGQLAVDGFPIPPNDDFAGATLLEDFPAAITADLRGATLEAEPYCPGERSVWYRFVMPYEAAVRIVPAAGSAALVGVYSGTDLGALQQFACGGPIVTSPIAASTTVYLQVSAYDSPGSNYTSASFSVELIAPPPHDDFADARQIASMPFADTVAAIAAGIEPGEPLQCGTSNRSVWYRYDAPADVLLRVDASATTFRPELAIYIGSALNTLTTVACGSPIAIAQAQVSAGQTVFIQVEGPYFPYDLDEPLRIEFSTFEVIANDDLGAATALEALPFVETVNLENATRESGEHTTCGFENSVWYRYTPTEDVRLRVSSELTYGDVELSAYTGGGFGTMNALDCVRSGSGTAKIEFNATADTPVLIKFAGDVETGIRIRMVPDIANDSFASAKEIATLPFDDSLYSVGLTTEPGEPGSCFGSGGGERIDATAWYRFTADEQTVLRIDFSGSRSSTLLAVYAGDAFGSLTQETCENGPPYEVRLRVLAGQTIYIQVGGAFGAMGDIALRIEKLTPPANDLVGDATEVGALPFSHSVNTTGALKEPGEGSVCGDVAGTVWYRYTAPADETIAIETSGLTYTVVDAYIDSGAGLEYASCTDYFRGDRIQLDLIAGETAFFQVGGMFDHYGHLTVDIDRVVVPGSDDFADATQITQLPFTDSFEALAATAEPGEIASCIQSMHTVWYRFEPAVDVRLAIDTAGSTVDTVIGVYTGASLGTLSRVLCDDGYAYAPPLLFVDADAGVPVYIQVGTWHEYPGTTVLNVRVDAPPSNDDAVDAVGAGSLPFTDRVDIGGATLEPGETSSCWSMMQSVWYRYTAATDVTLYADTLGSFVDTVIAAYVTDGSQLPPPESTEVACDANYGERTRITFDLQAGETSYIRAGSYQQTFGPIAVRLLEFISPPNDEPGNALDLAPLPLDIEVDIVAATKSLDEPDPCDSTPRTVWYRYAAPTPTTIAIDAEGSSFDTVLAAYVTDGDAPRPDAAWDACASYTPPLVPQSHIQVDLEAGQALYVQVGAAGDDLGELRLHIHAVAPPANDRAASAMLISALPFLHETDTSQAAIERGEYDPCSISIGRTVWYRLDAPKDMRVRVDSNAGNFATILAAYVNPADGLPFNTSPRYPCGGSAVEPEIPEVSLAQGDVLFIQLGGFQGAGGTAVLGVTELDPAPVNDQFDRALPLSNLPFTDTRSMAGATAEVGESACSDFNDQPSVWYQITTAHDALLTIDTTGSDMGVALGAYVQLDSSSPPGAVGLLACDVGNEASGAFLVLDIAAGETVALQASLSSTEGSLHISFDAECEAGSGTACLPPPTPTPTPTETSSPTPSPTDTPTDTPSPSATPSDTPSPSPTPTETPSPSPTASDTPLPTLSVTPSPSATTTPPLALCARAEVSGDGRLTGKDIAAIVRHMTNRSPYEARYDLDGDGRVGLRDLRLMVRCLIDSHR